MISKLAIWMMTAAVTAPGAIQVVQDTVRADRTYEAAGGGKLEGLGVCSVSETTVDCWDMDGKPNPALVEQVRAHFLTQPSDTLRLSYRKKNRLIAVRQSQRVSAYANPNLAATKIEQTFSINSEGENIQFYRCAADPKTKTVSIPFLVSLPNEAPVSLRTEKGAEVVSGGFGVQFRSFEGGPKLSTRGFGNSWPGSNTGAGPSWYLNLTWSQPATQNNEVQSLLQGLALEATDEKGEALRWVDSSGKPVSETAVQAEFNRMSLSGQYPTNPKFRQVMLLYVGGTGKDLRYQTNVDPKFVKSIRMWKSRSVAVELSGFPLDPVKQE